ncbi:MAG: O-antigen polysaccharide polymerase Wzy [Lachnospiraceae bacterium]
MEIKIKTKNMRICFAWLLLTLMCYSIYAMFIKTFKDGVEYDVLIYILSWFGIVLAMFIVISWKWVTGSYITAYTIVVLFLILYGYGQTIMWAFGIHTDYEIGRGRLFDSYAVQSDDEIVNMLLFIYLCILCFHLGALLCRKKTGSSGKIVSNERKIMLYVSCAVLVLCVIVLAPVIINNIKVALQGGYTALFDSDEIENNPLIQISKEMFFPSLIGILIGSKYSKRAMTVCYLVFACYAVAYSTAGSRGSWFPYLVVLIWLHVKNCGGLQKKNIFKIGIVALLLMYILQFIKIDRSQGDLSELFLLSNFPLVDLIFEMGGSAAVTLISLEKQIVWPYTNSMLLSVLAAPTTRILDLLHMELVLPASWFSEKILHINWGSGYSIFAEVYSNFGVYIGPILMIIVGWAAGTLLYEEGEKNTLKIFIVACTLGVVVKLGRVALIEITRSLFRGVLLYYVVIKVIAKLLRNKNIKEKKNDS